MEALISSLSVYIVRRFSGSPEHFHVERPRVEVVRTKSYKPTHRFLNVKIVQETTTTMTTRFLV